jgi:hypothetical protein
VRPSPGTWAALGLGFRLPPKIETRRKGYWTAKVESVAASGLPSCELECKILMYYFCSKIRIIVFRRRPDGRIPVMAGPKCIEFAGPERVRKLMQAANVRIIRKRKTGPVVELQLLQHGDDSRIPSKWGNPRKLSHNHETPDNPAGCGCSNGWWRLPHRQRNRTGALISANQPGDVQLKYGESRRARCIAGKPD